MDCASRGLANNGAGGCVAVGGKRDRKAGARKSRRNGNMRRGTRRNGNMRRGTRRNGNMRRNGNTRRRRNN